MKNTLLVLLCSFAFSSFGQNMYLNIKAGNSNLYSISSINKITFENGDVIIETNSYTDNFSISGTRSITFQPFVTHFDKTIIVESNYLVYPNPCNEVLSLYGASRNALYVIRDLKGSVVQKGTGGSLVNVANLVSGVYFISLVSENKTIKK